MEKIKPRLYQLTIALSLISLILALVSSGKQREFFYIAIYVSIIGLAFEYKKITLRPFTIALPILLIGLLNLGWYLLYEYHNEGLNLYSDYLGASKKLILASVLIFYIDRFKFYIDKDTFRKFFFFATALGFVLATGYGLWQASQGMTRVEMAINRATVSAYVYSVLSLAFVSTEREAVCCCGLHYINLLLRHTVDGDPCCDGFISASGNCAHALSFQKDSS